MPAMTTEAIRAKLATLDPTNDEQWTGDGLPDLGLFPGTKRSEVTAAAPRFSRKTLEEGIAFEAIPETNNAPPEPPKPPDDDERPSTSDAYVAWCKRKGFRPDATRLEQMKQMETQKRQAEAYAKKVLEERVALASVATKLGPRKSPIDAAYAQRRPTDRPPPPNPVK